MGRRLAASILGLGLLVPSLSHADPPSSTDFATLHLAYDYDRAQSILHQRLIERFQQAPNIYAKARAAQLIARYRVDEAADLLIANIQLEVPLVFQVERPAQPAEWNQPTRWPAVDALAALQLSAARPVISAIRRDTPPESRALLILSLRRLAGSEVAVALLAQEIAREDNSAERRRLEQVIAEIRHQQAQRWPVAEPSAAIIITHEPERESHTTQHEIDAAAALDFESSRLQGLLQIARRPGIRGRDQAYLVHAIYTRMDFESSRRTLLLALIENPDFANAGKEAILKGLKDRLDFEATKRDILSALSRRSEPRW